MNTDKLLNQLNKLEISKCRFPTGVINIHLDRLAKNIKVIKDRVKVNSGTSPLFLLPVKSNAYGHGIIPVSKYVESEKLCDYFGVATLQEALILRKNGIKKPILVLGQISLTEDSLREPIQNNIEVEVSDLQTMKQLNSIAESIRQKARIHISIDTGMGRTGALPKDVPDIIKALKSCKSTILFGVMTHFSVADEMDAGNKNYTNNQIETFQKVKEEFIKHIKSPIIFHTSNSAGALLQAKSIFDMIRPGIASYGYPDENIESISPAMEIKSSLTLIKSFPKGSSIGYGRTYNTESDDERIGVVPVGYGDGLSRALSNSFEVIINGARRKSVGRISMDQCAVKVGAGDKVGDDVTIMGKNGNESIDARELARQANTIPYEVLCNMGSSTRLRHEYFKM